MKFYVAALYTNDFSRGSRSYNKLTNREKCARDDVENILESYHYVNRQSVVDKMRADRATVFLDSGAFSAFTKGLEVNLPAYCDYIKRNTDILERIGTDVCASVLDGIGDPILTWENQSKMEQLGVKPIPCFHYGEDTKYLDWYIENYDYVTIGGMVPISRPQLILWLDYIWKNHLTKPDGSPKIKIHGFGLTTLSMMKRYPWHSIDSSSWVQIAGNGSIVIPGYGALSMSPKSPNAKLANRSIETLTPAQRDAVELILDEQGFEVERLKHEYVSRWVYNCWAYGEISKNLNATKEDYFLEDQMGLFS